MAYQSPPPQQQQYYQQPQQYPGHSPSPHPQQYPGQSPSPHPQQYLVHTPSSHPQQSMQVYQAQGHSTPAPAYQGQAPMQAVHQAQVGNPSGWQNSLMDCGPCESCCLGTFLPCMLLGNTSEHLRDPSGQTHEAFNTDCLLMCGITYITGCGWIYVMMKRSEIRERFGIQGDGCGDCMTAYWCGCCALIQQDKEVKLRLPASAPVTQGYQAQGGMVMPSGKQ